jgi:hypothetical protein
MAAITILVELFPVGGILFYAIALGKEGFATWCALCYKADESADESKK